MDCSSILKELSKEIAPQSVAVSLAEIAKRVPTNSTLEVYRRCFSMLDLTSLGTKDSSKTIREFTRKVVDLRGHFADTPRVAAVCVFPLFVEDVGVALGDTDIAIASTGGGFPHGHTYPEVRVLECSMAVENGADEVDIVMNVGAFLEGDYNFVASEIALIKEEIGEDALLKVIIESGELLNLNQVREATLVAMAAGADFVKTSTGKTAVSATPEAVVVMCGAIADYHKYCGRQVGIKVAGGVRQSAQAVLYYSIVQSILGEQWITPEYFRIGASGLANSLLSDIYGREISYF